MPGLQSAGITMISATWTYQDYQDYSTADIPGLQINTGKMAANTNRVFTAKLKKKCIICDFLPLSRFCIFLTFFKQFFTTLDFGLLKFKILLTSFRIKVFKQAQSFFRQML